MFSKMLDNVRKQVPLVHFITNYVTTNDCANLLLALGGSPIMADDRNEVEDITTICSSLVINMGTLNERTVESMILAGKKANECNHPVIFDPVGAGASAYRNEIALRLCKEVKIAVIRGNMSEIKFIASGVGNTKGVDADVNDVLTEENKESVIDFAQKLSKETGAVIAISGETDVIATADQAFLVYNGDRMMCRITGTGCMLNGIIAAFVGTNPNHILEATTAAIVTICICGEKAVQKVKNENSGIGSFRTYLIDEMSKITGDDLEKGMKIDEVR